MAFPFIVVGLIGSNVIARRSFRRFRRALATEDINVARAEYSQLVDLWRPRGKEIIKAYHVNILLLEEKYREALAELELLDGKLPKRGIPVLQNQIAWCQMQLGDVDEGLQIAQAALPELEKMGRDYGWSGHDVLGTGLFLKGKPAEAVPHLEMVCANCSHLPSMKVAASFYLGESFRALGELQKAQEAYKTAHDTLPTSRYARRSAERLEDLDSSKTVAGGSAS